ncbi:MAG: hypothetical protein E6Q85_09820 [Thiothrix sp.]|nr:MAG: hypothetical protein E6Q85_09820 [Thiothrix sp.]
MRKIVICATQRSGSTMLCKELEATTVLGRPQEIYINPQVTNLHEAQSFIKKIMQKCQSSNEVFAVKIMQSQWTKVNSVHSFEKYKSFFLESLFKKYCRRKPIDEILFNQVNHFYEFYKDATWIFLRRRDCLYQAISREMAHQTRVCHILNTNDVEKNAGIGQRTSININESSNYNQKAIYKAENIQRRIQEIKNEEIAWLYFFENYRLKPIELFYEDIVDDKLYLQTIATKVGVSLPRQLNTIPLVKVRNVLNDEWAERFRNEASLRS